MAKSSRIVKACRWEGCLALADGRRGCCKTHQWKYQNLHYSRPYYPKRQRIQHARLLLQWLSRDRRQYRDDSAPLTLAQRRIYQSELNTLLHQRNPQTQIQYAKCCSLAAIFARRGGYQQHQHDGAVKARMAGWRRRWLRNGEYDIETFVQGLTALEASRKVSK